VKVKDEDKTKEQLINELVELRQRVAELEKLESKCRQAEEALRGTETRYHSIFENAVEGIFWITLDGRILAANQAAARMLGYGSPEELIAEVTDIRQIYIDLNRRDELIHLMQTKGVVTGFEVQIRRKDGSVIWTSANIQASRDESGRIVGFVGMGVDITERKQAEEKLRESEIRYRTLFEQSPDGVLIIDPQTAIAIEFNEVAHCQLGYTREEFKRLRIFDYEAKETFEETKAHIEKVLHEGRYDFETKHRTKDDEIRNVLVTIQTIELSGRIFFHCIFRDITELKLAEEALHESEMSYRTLFEKAGDAILILEAEGENAGKIVAANKAAAKMHEYTVNELLTLKITDLDTPKVAKETPDRIRRSLRGEWIKEEITHRKKDGTVFPVEVSGGLIEFENHKYVLSFDRDITERKRSEEALRESEIRFRSVTQSAADAIISADSADNIISWNKGAQIVFGYTEEEAVGKPLIILIPERYRNAHQRGLKRVNSTGETRIIGKTVELSGLRKNGIEFPLELSLSTWKIGERRFYTAIIRDITERKHAEETLKNYAAKLEEANHLKDLFTDIMRHDLLNPLGVIKTAAEQLLFVETGDERMRNMLMMVKRNTDKLIDMIKSASMYAMLESTEKLERAKLDLNEVFTAVVNNFKPQLEEKNMKLEYISEGGCCIMANPMIDAVFSNLLSNAIKYSPAGREIEVHIIDKKESFRIDVKDWGYGIKDEDKAKLFTRFQRVDKKGVKGTGLGLAIVKRIVDLHGGKVWIEDNPEGGSVFCVEIPKISGSAPVRFPAGE
jgi:PAS domain S-box-containing protein